MFQQFYPCKQPRKFPLKIFCLYIIKYRVSQKIHQYHSALINMLLWNLFWEPCRVKFHYLIIPYLFLYICHLKSELLLTCIYFLVNICLELLGHTIITNNNTNTNTNESVISIYITETLH